MYLSLKQLDLVQGDKSNFTNVEGISVVVGGITDGSNSRDQTFEDC